MRYNIIVGGVTVAHTKDLKSAIRAGRQLREMQEYSVIIIDTFCNEQVGF